MPAVTRAALMDRLAGLEARVVEADRAAPARAAWGEAAAALAALLADADALLAEHLPGAAVLDPARREQVVPLARAARARLVECHRRLAVATSEEERLVALDLARGEVRRAAGLVRWLADPHPPAECPLQAALSLRRLFARFRRALAHRPCATGTGVEEALADAALAVEALKADEAFTHVRIADRLQLLDLHLQLERGGRAPRRLDEGLKLHRALQALATMFLGINERTVLRAHDAGLVTALLEALRSDADPALAAAALRLRALEGREEALDLVLAEPLEARELLRRAAPLLERLRAELAREAAPA